VCSSDLCASVRTFWRWGEAAFDAELSAQPFDARLGRPRSRCLTSKKFQSGWGNFSFHRTQPRTCRIG